MEKRGNGKIIAIVALVLAVAGLSLGFAAYSTSLQITTEAQFTPNKNWNVGFSTNGTTIEQVSTATALPGQTSSANNGSVDVTKYTINQTNGSTAILNTTDKTEVTYTLSIVNTGTLDAYPDSLTFASPNALTCSNVSESNATVIEGASGAGTSSTGGNTASVSQSDCDAMFGVSLSVNGTAYTPSNASTFSSNGTLTKAGGSLDSVPVVLRVWYKGDSAASAAAAKLDGDIKVTVGTITAVYKSNNS
ncbi:MAG: hypothetical protein IKN63_01425 [Bacilli bacterium]|nr:hypothetical protein [Bacilli bacterium]